MHNQLVVRRFLSFSMINSVAIAPVVVTNGMGNVPAMRVLIIFSLSNHKNQSNFALYVKVQGEKLVFK